jgi:hypothetical protein
MMRIAIVSVLVVVVGAGMALANPIIAENIYIDFDPPNYEHRIDPVPYTPFDAYIMVETFFDGPGFTAISFGLSLTPGMSSSTVFEILLPGYVVVGQYETGITITSTDCITADMQPMPIAVLHCLYTGLPGDIEVTYHPDYPGWIVLCDDSLQVFCVLSHGGVGKAPLGGDCGGNPVEDVSWGAIKALYR